MALYEAPLTWQKLKERMQRVMRVGNLDIFEKDQQRLMTTVIREGGEARAEVPIWITNHRSRREYNQTYYLPCVIAHVFVGEKNGPHKMYLLVVYIELPSTLKLDAAKTPGEESNYA
jgi:hypothetical protein